VIGRATSTCALYYAAEAYEADQPGVVGRQSAGAGFLEALVRHGGQDELFCLTNRQQEFDEFRRKVSTLSASPPRSTWVRPDDTEALGRAGCIYNPGPIIAELAWMRRYSNERLFSICGITHSLATDRAIRGIRDFLTAPTQPWDALVCTSRSGLAAVERIIGSWTDYLGRRGFGVPESPMRPYVIPLGVNADRFVRDAAAIDSGKRLRARLGIGDDDVAGLYFGRLNVLSKAHPTPMFRAFELAQRTMPPGRLHLILCGQFADPRTAQQFEAARRRFCPSVRVHTVNGNDAADSAASWFAADFFISLTDNIQETFGLTPVEAMAASLPCVVSDWDGYRETVIGGETGFLIDTTTPPPGAGIELADQLARRAYDHFSYIGLVSQSTAVDVDQCARAIITLANDPELRRRMGDAARRRAQAVYDWREVIRRYLELWSELAEIRASAPAVGARRDGETVHPDYPDPFSLFRAHPTRVLDDSDQVRLADLDGRFVVAQLRKNALHLFATPSLLDAESIDAMVAALETGPKTIEALRELTATADRGRLLRSIAWLYKYGIVSR
jgi:alpha-maltose-1-phosphate synthase